MFEMRVMVISTMRGVKFNKRPEQSPKPDAACIISTFQQDSKELPYHLFENNSRRILKIMRKASPTHEIVT